MNKFALRGKYKRAWVEESFSVDNANRAYLGTSVKNGRVAILALVAFGLLALALTKIFILQVIKGGEFRAQAEGNRVRLRPIPSERGIIYDRFGRELVRNTPNFSLALVPQDLPKTSEDRKKIIKEVVEISGADETLINDLLKKYGSYSYASLMIKENLNYETAIRLIIQSAHLPGVIIEKGSKRKYLLQTTTTTLSLSHILGYESKLNEEEYKLNKNAGYLLFDDIGKTGLEKIYEPELRGQYGRKKIEVDALGRERNVLAEEAPRPGDNIYLTIDIEAQAKLEQLLQAALDKQGKKKGAAVAMDPRDGSIIALVSLPAFDNNLFSGGIGQDEYMKYANDENNPLFDRAISGQYPSGSIVKMLVAAAALQEGIINSKTTVLSKGGLQVGRWFFKDWNAGGHGITNVAKAIAWSVNTFFYYIGGGYGDFSGLGADLLTKYLRDFGLAKKTAVDLPGEADGFVPSKEWKLTTKGEKWFVGDTYNLSIGQGDLLVTPIQAAAWTAAVANGGFIVTPHLAAKIENTLKKKSVEIEYEKRRGPVSASNMAVVRAGMRECVTYGSCKIMQTLPFAAGGKTGTAQWSKSRGNHAWFTSFAPYDSPKIVVTVLVEEGGQGSSVSQPVARDFLAWWGKKYIR